MNDKVNTAALERFSGFGGMYLVEGAYSPLVLPRGEPEQMDFDRQVCACGLSVFVRPKLPSDGLLNTEAGGHILVKEISPGIRTRHSMLLFDMPAERN